MEQIYTIPVNEAFDLVSEKPECGCPFCVLFKKLQNDEIDIYENYGDNENYQIDYFL